MPRFQPSAAILAIVGGASTGSAAVIGSPDDFGADATVITFEGLGDGAAFDLLPGGVRFASEWIDRIGGPDAIDPGDVTGRFSQPMFALSAQVGGGEPIGERYASGAVYLGWEVSDMRIDFDTPVGAVAMWFIDNDFADVRLRAFASDGTLLDSLVVPQVFEGGSTFAGLAAGPSSIAYLIIDGPDGAVIDSTFIDDLTYVVPSPVGSLWVGAAFVAARRRHRSRRI